MQEIDVILGLCAAAAAVALGLSAYGYVKDIPEDPNTAREREVLAAFERHPQRRNGIATLVAVDEDRATVVVSHPETPAKCESWTFRLTGSEWLRTGVFS